MTDLAVSLPPGLLLDVHATGLLSWGDVHVAQKVSYLYREDDQRVQLALALTVRALRQGMVCLDLGRVREEAFESDEVVVAVPEQLWPESTGWQAAIRSSPLVAVGAAAAPDRPLRLVGDLLYLQRYWQDETTVVDELTTRLTQSPPGVDVARLRAAHRELFEADADGDQQLAAVVCALAPVSVIAGGPGTGKTTTLARMLGMLARTQRPAPVIALAAPTGKAAARMEEALSGEIGKLPADLAASLGGLRALTIHRLLGWQPGTGARFRHDRGNPLPHDVVVVDEASMVSVTLLARLLSALRPHARLVLIGDPDQLAPVEAGPVLRDIVDAAPTADARLAEALTGLALTASGPVVRLRHNHRSRAVLAKLAAAVRDCDAELVVAIATGGGPEIEFAANLEATDLRQRMCTTGAAMIAAARAGRVSEALASLDEHRLLCAHRRGPFGVAVWSRQVEEWLAETVDGFDPLQPWYPGRPLLVTRNAPELGLYNGDTGVVVQDDGGLQAHFARGDRVHSISPFLLDSVQTIHAMTIHKAQGSQFDRVSIVLPPPESPLLTRELLYTAITRAREQVTLIGSQDALVRAVTSPARAASGLRDRLRQPATG